jgi:MFS family permease
MLTILVWLLMTGQILQSLASSSVWIVAFATLADNVDESNKGKVLGTAMSFVGTGIFAGPMVSGFLLQLLGYWPAWSAALFLLTVDVAARLLMIETKPATTEQPQQTDETSALLSGEGSATDPNTKDKAPASGFYRIMLRDPHILAGTFNTLILSVILAAFDTTLPLHVRALFGWKSLPVGIIFFGLQVPSIALGPAIGHLRDRVGLRWPTVIGCGSLVPLIWLMGVPGKDLPWGRLEHGGEAVYITAVVGLGFAFALVRGAGTFQIMGTYLLHP